MGAHHVQEGTLSQDIYLLQMEPDAGGNKPRVHPEEQYILVLRAFVQNSSKLAASTPSQTS